MEKSEPKHIVAEKKIREFIKHCKADEKIPGERVYAQQLGISYMTARKAVESLVAKGLLYKIPKKGTYVSGQRTTRRKTKNIGYFLDSSIKQGLSSPYYALIFDAIEKEAAKKGYSLIYFSDASESGIKSTMEKLDGVIVSCFPRIEELLHKLKAHAPVICIDNGSADESIPSVTIDNKNAVSEAISHLISLGHHRIGFITGLDDSKVGRDRYNGYLSALSDHGLNVETDLVYKGDYTFKTGSDAADYFLSLDRLPTAIMCANDTMAIGAIKEIKSLGHNVPDDISIMGFDDIAVASQMSPALTTVAAPVKELAKQCVIMLSKIIDGTEPDNMHISIPARLVLRNTCAHNRTSADKANESGNTLAG